ncbi:hypothetical protein BDV93DRAFT_554867 [Ceratobasidium sp. AG-I]|nr:hypothetical protein BDV93DRAFT_554867 [Ceratobasidium sp. AG-I]
MALKLNSVPSALQYLEAHTKASKATQVLLNSLGIPEVSFPELLHLGDCFVCERCNETQPQGWVDIANHYVQQCQDWNDIQVSVACFCELGIIYYNNHDPKPRNNVNHYVKQGQDWNDIQVDVAHFHKLGIIYHNSHDLQPFNTARPLIRLLSTEDRDVLVPEINLRPRVLLECLLCRYADFDAGERRHRYAMYDHLLYIHGISQPELQDLSYDDEEMLKAGRTGFYNPSRNKLLVNWS